MQTVKSPEGSEPTTHCSQGALMVYPYASQCQTFILLKSSQGYTREFLLLGARP
jgi:hypothetical protein